MELKTNVRASSARRNPFKVKCPHTAHYTKDAETSTPGSKAK